MANFSVQSKTIGPIEKLPFVASDRGNVFVTNGITLDAAAVTADGNGDKILKAGSIVGKLSSGKFAPALPGVEQATFNDAVENGGIVIYSNKRGLPVSVEFVDPNTADADLSVSVASTKVIVSLGNDGAADLDDAKNTATLIAAEINGHADAKKLVTAEVKDGDSGAGSVSAVIAETFLVESTAMSEFAVIVEEANLKDGDEVVGGLYAAGKFDESFMPDAVNGVLLPGLKALFPTSNFI